MKPTIRTFLGSFFGRSVILMTLIDLIGTAVLVWTGRTSWIAGVWVSAVWFVINSLLLWRIADWVTSGQMPDQRKIIGWCVIKFPVLYLGGLGLLMIPGIQIRGVLVSFTAFLTGLLIVQLLNIKKRA